jgi:hypothetical protein
MSDRPLDQLELGARVAQSLIAENDLSPAARQAALAWRGWPAVAPPWPTATPARAWQPAPALTTAASGFCRAA